MKTLRIVVLGALTLTCAQAFAQDTPAMQQTPQAAQGTAAVGGVPSMSSEMGAPMGKTREQVYQELLQSQQNGQAARLQELYKGS